jgi:flotillin
MVDSAVKIKISSRIDLLQIAAENFLNKDEDYIIAQLQDVLEGNMREIVGQMRLSDMVSNRKVFAEKVQGNAALDMANMGLEIVSFNVQNFIDRNGVIEDLGVDNITRIKKAAAIAKAEGERDISMAQANADKQANNARVEADSDIAKRQTDLLINKAELKMQADIKQARADAAYRIQEEEQRKSIEVASVQADIAKKEMEVELKAKEAEVTERTLESEIKKKADAEKYARQLKADADLYEHQLKAQAELYERQKDAEAQRYAVEQEAIALKSKAEAEKFAKEQQAEGIRSVGYAEAESIKAKALSEAEGIDKKAEAMTKMGRASVLEMYFNVLPEVVKNAAAPLSNVDKITMYGDGNGTKLVKDIIQSTVQVTDGLKASTGIDIASLLAGFLGGKLTNDAPKSDIDS